MRTTFGYENTNAFKSDRFKMFSMNTRAVSTPRHTCGIFYSN